MNAKYYFLRLFLSFVIFKFYAKDFESQHYRDFAIFTKFC